VTVRQHLAVLRSYGWLIVASVLLAAIGAGIATFVLPRAYEGQARLYVGQSIEDRRIDVDGLEASRLIADTYAQLATSRTNLNAAIDALGLTMSADELAGDVAAELLPDSTLLTISARSDDPDTAADIANAVADVLLAQAPDPDPEDEALRARIDALDAATATVESDLVELIDLPRTAAREARSTLLQQRLEILVTARESLAEKLPGVRTNALTLIDPATPPIDAVGPGRAVIVGLATVVALIGAVSLAYILAAWRAPLAIER
jgi:capsular polysaccharide biosynthesis protein